MVVAANLAETRVAVIDVVLLDLNVVRLVDRRFVERGRVVRLFQARRKDPVNVEDGIVSTRVEDVHRH